MSVPAVLYNLHDNIIEQFNFDLLRGRLIVIVWENLVDSTTIIWRQLTISGIKNVKEVEQYQKQIELIARKAKRTKLGYCIDEFKYCDTPKSETRNLYLFLNVDYLGILTINCAKFTIKTLDESSAKDLLE